MSVGILLFYHLSQLFNSSQIVVSMAEMGSNNFKCALIDVLCLLWVTTGFSHLLLLRLFTSHGFGHCTFLILCVWNVDNGALFAGSSARNLFKGNDVIGHQFFPKQAIKSMEYLSPSKSWTGVVGGLMLGCSTSIFLVYCMSSYSVKDDILSSSTPSLNETCYLFHSTVTLPCWKDEIWYLLGVGISLLAIIGDLFESSLKRFVKIKDSGAFFPGHGGCLDRMDSALLSGIWYFYMVRLLEEYHYH